MEENSNTHPDLHINQNKKVFESLENQGRTFEDESDEFAGENVNLNFIIKKAGDSNGKQFTESFKAGQDFEYVKYKIAGLFELDPDNMVKKNNFRLCI